MGLQLTTLTLYCVKKGLKLTVGLDLGGDFSFSTAHGCNSSSRGMSPNLQQPTVQMKRTVIWLFV